MFLLLVDIQLSSLAFAYVKPEENDVSVFNNVLFPLLDVLTCCLHFLLRPQFHQIRVLHHFCTNETFFKVSVYDSCGLGSLCQFADGPASYLICSRCEVINQVKGLVACLDDLGNHTALFRLRIIHKVSFILSTVGDDLSWHVGIDIILDLL